MKEPDNRIILHLDRERIHTVLAAAYGICKDYMRMDFLCTQKEFVAKIDPFLESNRVTIPVLLDLPITKNTMIKIEVDLRRQKVFARMQHKTKQAQLNYMLKAL